PSRRTAVRSRESRLASRSAGPGAQAPAGHRSDLSETRPGRSSEPCASFSMSPSPWLLDNRSANDEGGYEEIFGESQPVAGPPCPSTATVFLPRLDGGGSPPGDIRYLSARLDGLAAMDDADRVEVERPRLIRPDTHLEAFALRALGLVRRDAGLIETAAARFDGLGLEWHGALT